ncbi:hypothetical protein ACR79T_16690 [Sphingobacterium spiritivorum]|uniref:hypothetical protein n=1 Tax=Sphingobacterium spiritivorum TaxID=258 RepID=UPI003DA6C966
MRYILFFLIVLVSCGQEKKRDVFIKERLKEINDRYFDEKKTLNFSDKMINHFPENIDHLPIKISTNIHLKNENKYKLLSLVEFNIENRKIDSLKLSFNEKHTIEKFTATDSSLKILTKKEECGNYIPFFNSTSLFDNPEDVVKKEDVYSNLTKSGLSKDFEIYVLESGSLSPKETSQANMNEIGNSVKCFSKGICLNKTKKIIIYWIILW